MTYNEKMQTVKDAKIAELLNDIEQMKTMRDGDILPGDTREFVATRLPRYLRKAAVNLRVAQAADPLDFTGFEGHRHILFENMFEDD